MFLFQFDNISDQYSTNTLNIRILVVIIEYNLFKVEMM